MSNTITTAITVIGSGPGGAITAARLAEAGRQVLLVEEGAHLPQGSVPNFSLKEISQKYRNGGVTVGFGNAKVAYVEGRVVGGGSEVNRGMYHRIHSETLEEWGRSHRVDSLSLDDLRPHFDACESITRVSDLPGVPPMTSMKLHEGAQKLGWKSLQVPRLVQYEKNDDGRLIDHKEAMSTTWIPRFLAAGGTLLADTRVSRFKQHSGKWHVDATTKGGQPLTIVTDRLFLACGAIHTPALLRRSGIKTNIGNSLRFHPMLKVVAQFREEINLLGVPDPVHQVVEYDPKFSLGSSMSLRPLLALSMCDHQEYMHEVEHNWKQMGIYYTQTVGGYASVRNVPWFRDPLVRVKMDESSLHEVADGLKHLCQALLASGAIAIYPGIAGSAVIHSQADVDRLPDVLPPDKANLSTLHLFSSCPMGEDRVHCATDSFGNVHGVDRLHIADASLLCGPTVVNPQGTVMAVAHRNVQHFLN